MAYIGRGLDKISNVEKLDNLTFDGSSTSYSLLKGGVSFTPSSANNILLSIDGVVQAGNFTVSGSTIDFGTAVSASSTCDFILHYGVGVITTPSDGSVTGAKIASSAVDLTSKVTGTLPIANGGIGATTLAGAGISNAPSFFAHSSGTQTGITDATWTKATLGTVVFDTDSAFASDKFTVPSGQGGKYCFFFKINSAGSTDYQKTGYSALYKNGSQLPNSGIYETVIFQESGVFNMDRIGIHGSVILDLSVGDYIELYGQADVNSGTVNFYHSFLGGYKLLGV